MSRSPNPPYALGLVRVSHATQHIFLVPYGLSHQNLVSADWIRLQSETDSMKVDIVWFGMAVNTDFNIVNFPALDRNFVVQLAALCRILSTTEVNRSLFRLPKCSGRPKYLPKPLSLLIPNNHFTSSFDSDGVLEEKVIADFSLFILCPEALSYSASMVAKLVQLSGEE